jgi:hypothetical protein
MDKEKPEKAESFSVLESTALEVESFSRDFKAGLMQLDQPEKLAGLCSVVMFWAGFLPWFSPSDTHTQSGLDGFATPHFGISVAVLLLLHRWAGQRGRKEISLEPGRVALAFLGLGALSTVTCIALLIHFGDIAAYSHGPVVRYGFYLVLLSGIGISACGIGKLR